MNPDRELYQKNIYKNLIDECLEIVKQYIIDNDLMLVGGMAIDLALREKGDQIYDEDELPDYDIISPNNLKHASELAEILCNKGFPDINSIGAAHITTMRVRMKNVVLFDATFVPEIVYKRVPSMHYKELRVIHPHAQFIDQRLSLSNLSADTGLDLNIYNRLKKDLKRNELLRSYYPIELKKQTFRMSKIKLPKDLIKVDKTQLNKVHEDCFIYGGLNGSCCLTGVVAAEIMIMVGLNDFGPIMIPEELNISLLTNGTDWVKDAGSYYKPLLNLKPITKVCDKTEYQDTYGKRIGCNIINYDNMDIMISCVDYILMELLRDMIHAPLRLNQYYKQLYKTLCDIVDKKRIDPKSDNIWFPTLNCYGAIDLPEKKVFALLKILDDTTGMKPKNSYLRKPVCSTKKDFNPEESEFFNIDGSEYKETPNHTNHIYVLDMWRDFLENQK